MARGLLSRQSFIGRDRVLAMKFRLTVLAALALLTAQTARAEIAFDTINYGTPVNFSGPISDGTTVAGQSFFSTSQLDFASISVSLLANNPSDGGSAMVYLVADDGTGNANGVAGAPDFGNIQLIGKIADSLISNEDTGIPSIFTFTDVANTLAASTQNDEYWIVIDFGTYASSAEWVYNSDASGIGTSYQAAYSDANGGVYPTNGTGFAGPFALEVNTPEPASIALLGGALVGIGFLRRRKINP